MTSVVAVMVVRDAADCVVPAIRNVLALGAERVIVRDHDSRDGTTRLLDRLARRHPVDWSPHEGPFDQAAIITALMGEAVAGGADWVLPMDADEFWWCGRGLLDVLDHTDAGVLYCPVLQFLQRADVREVSPRGLLTMTRRTSPRAPDHDPQGVVERGEASVLEITPPRKVIVRAGPGIGVIIGNHDAVNPPGPLAPADDIEVLHAPLRARSALLARGGRFPHEGPPGAQRSWHSHRWTRLAADGPQALEDEWRANAYGPDGTLRVGGRTHATVEDLRLRDAAAPWVRRRGRVRA